jgi:hypothetical protein
MTGARLAPLGARVAFPSLDAAVGAVAVSAETRCLPIVGAEADDPRRADRAPAKGAA